MARDGSRRLCWARGVCTFVLLCSTDDGAVLDDDNKHIRLEYPACTLLKHTIPTPLQ